MSARNLSLEDPSRPAFLTFSRPQAIVTALANIAIICAFLWMHEPSWTNPSSLVALGLILAFAGFGVIWNGMKRARAIRSVRDKYRQALIDAETALASVAEAELKQAERKADAARRSYEAAPPSKYTA